MGPENVQASPSAIWRLAARQHGVVSRIQLLHLGLSGDAIKHRVATGRLHPVWRGVYAVGRPQLTLHGSWMAAVLSCGTESALSHESAAALWGIRTIKTGEIEVSVPVPLCRRRPGIVVHRRARLAHRHLTRRGGIPVTSLACTMVDLATRVTRDELEAAVGQADQAGLIDPESLRDALVWFDGTPGVATLRTTLDRRTFTLTESALERRFLPIARRAGLARPSTGQYVNGFKVDFYWPELGLIVETDGVRYHRTPSQQAKDRLRDQAHVAAGLTPLRFTHAQVTQQRAHVEATLAAVARRLEADPVTIERFGGLETPKSRSRSVAGGVEPAALG